MRILFIAMTLTVALSNYLAQFQINDWLTLGAFSFPFTFLITEICNRNFGARNARKIAFAGFAVAVVLSVALSFTEDCMRFGPSVLAFPAYGHLSI